MEVKSLMTEMSNQEEPLFKEVVVENDSSGEMKTQFTIELNQYDTSKMPGYVEGQRIYKGYTVKFATLKPNKPRPRSRIDFDPTNESIRNAILELFAKVDQLKEEKI